MLPDATLLEALAVLKRLSRLRVESRAQILGKLVRNFFLNPVEVTTCPFLAGENCRVYEDRFFGCRAYGLWSRTYYEEISRQDREARTQLRYQWEKLGVSLPTEIVAFRKPYCTDVQTVNGPAINDEGLESISDSIESLSGRLSPWHEAYGNGYFSDISFLATSLIWGVTEAVQLKFEIVKAVLHSGDRAKLTAITTDLPDILKHLKT